MGVELIILIYVLIIVFLESVHSLRKIGHARNHLELGRKNTLN